MSYIQQSISSGEKVVHIGRFHWIYLASAFFWIIFGVVGCGAVISAGMALNVHNAGGGSLFGGSLFGPGGWSQAVAAQGGYIAVIRGVSSVIRMAAFGVLLLGLALFAHMMIIRATTEIAVTTNRLVLKEGIIARHVDEMNIDRIESVHVIQSAIGRMLDFGTVMVRGMGVGEIFLPPIAHPVVLRNAIEKAREVHGGTHE